MGCGAGRSYSKDEVETYLNQCQTRLPSAELLDGDIIKLTSNNGFFNSSSLLDSRWLQNKMTNNEYRHAIEQINQRIAQAIIGTSNTLPINQIPTSGSTILATEELNVKYTGRVHFVYRHNEQGNSMESYIYINFK